MHKQQETYLCGILHPLGSATQCGSLPRPIYCIGQLFLRGNVGLDLIKADPLAYAMAPKLLEQVNCLRALFQAISNTPLISLE